jgi:hypothetical protein
MAAETQQANLIDPPRAVPERPSEVREMFMRPWRLAWLVLPIALVGCGGDKPKATLAVTCHGSVTLAGARSIDLLGDLVNGRPTISFPDPANSGKTGTLSVAPASRCTITPDTSGG